MMRLSGPAPFGVVRLGVFPAGQAVQGVGDVVVVPVRHPRLASGRLSA
jgi:hypothetical protein